MPKRSEIEFDENTVKRSKPAEKTYQLRDRLHKGLILRVMPTGTKSWMVEVERNVIRKVDDAEKLTLGQARTKATQMQGGHSKGKKIKSSRSTVPTLKKFIDGKYRDHARATYKTSQRGDQVADRILTALEADPPILKKKLDKLSRLDLERWKRKRGADVAKTTLKRDLGAVSTALNFAVSTHKFIDENPALGVMVKIDEDKRVRFLSDDERKRLLAALDKRDSDFHKARANNAENRRRRGLEALPNGEFKDYLTPLTILVMNTGLRRSEALSLDWENVELEGIPRLTVKAAMTKTSKTRHVPLNETAVDILKRWRVQTGDSGPVFIHRVTGTRLNKAHRAWKKLMKDAEIDDFRFHDLRHDFASQLVMKGQPLYLVKELLGHGSIEMTQRYAHLADDALAKAVEVLG